MQRSTVVGLLVLFTIEYFLLGAFLRVQNLVERPISYRISKPFIMISLSSITDCLYDATNESLSSVEIFPSVHSSRLSNSAFTFSARRPITVRQDASPVVPPAEGAAGGVGGGRDETAADDILIRLFVITYGLRSAVNAADRANRVEDAIDNLNQYSRIDQRRFQFASPERLPRRLISPEVSG